MIKIVVKENENQEEEEDLEEGKKKGGGEYDKAVKGLKDCGYSYERQSNTAHEVWSHPSGHKIVVAQKVDHWENVMKDLSKPYGHGQSGVQPVYSRLEIMDYIRTGRIKKK